MEALKKNETWELVTLSRGQRTVGFGWVYFLKHKESWWLYREGSYCGERFHTNLWHRLSRDVCSCGQTKLNSIRVILSVAANRSWSLHQLDVKKKRPFFMETSTNRFIWVLHQVFELRGRKGKFSGEKKGDIWYQAVSSGLVRDMKFGYDEDRRVSREGMLIIPCS